MKYVLVELFSERAEQPIIRMPGREYPAIVVQGDTLRTLLSLAQEARKHIASGSPTSKSIDDIDWICEILEERMADYEAALTRHGLPLPYPKDESS